MSFTLTLVCDECGVVIDGADVRKGRRWIRERAIKQAIAVKIGRSDLCAECGIKHAARVLSEPDKP